MKVNKTYNPSDVISKSDINKSPIFSDEKIQENRLVYVKESLPSRLQCERNLKA